MSVAPAPAPAPAPHREPPRAGLGAAVHSEWIKVRTVRSTWITLVLTIIISVGLGAAIAAAVGSSVKDGSFTGTYDPTNIGFSGFLFGQLALAVLGALVITSEYSTGMIRTSLAAVPRRGRLLAAKAVVFTGVGVVVGEITGFAAFFVSQAVLGINARHATLGQPHVTRAVIGAGLDLVLIGLLSLGVGALLRNTAASITVMVAVLFVLPSVSHALPSSVGNPIRKFWPSEAGQQITSVHRDHHAFSAWLGFGWMALITAVVLVVAGTLMSRRDA